MNANPTFSYITGNTARFNSTPKHTVIDSLIIQTLRTVKQSNAHLGQITRLALAAMLVLISVVSTSVSAALIYSDDFERANSSHAGSDWLEHEADSNDIAIYQDRLRLRDYINTGLTHAAITLDTSGFDTLQLSIDYSVLSSTEASDTFGVMIDGINFWSIGLGDGGSYSQLLDLAPYANNKPALQLSFWLDVNSHTETVYLEEVSLFGEPLRSAPNEKLQAVPEPATFGLMSFGFATLLMLRNRKPKARSITSQQAKS